MNKLGDYIEAILDNRGKNPPYYSNNGEHPVLDNYLIDGNKYPSRDKVKRYIDEAIFNSFIRKYAKKDDLAITLVGNGCGRCCLVPEADWVIIQNTIGLQLKSSADSHYLYYYLKLNRTRIQNLDGGSSQPNVRLDNFLGLEIDLPEILLQTNIAKVLSDLDAKIEHNNKINLELEAMAKLIYDYWFVQFEFPISAEQAASMCEPQLEGKPYKRSGGKMVWNEELKRKVPEGWEVKELGTELTVQRGISYKSSEINDDGIAMINLNSFNLNGTFKPSGIKKYSGKYSDKNLVSEGDLLIAITDVTRNADIIGKAIIVPNYYSELVISMDIAKISPSKKLSESFLMMLFNSNQYHNYIKWFASGTIVLHLNLDGMNWYKTEIPPKSLLNKFDSILLPITSRIAETNKQNQKLAELRDWLLPMLMNGQVRVS